MLLSTSWLLTAGNDTIASVLSRMVAYSGGECGCQQTKFKPKYAASFNSTHPQLSGIAHSAARERELTAEVAELRDKLERRKLSHRMIRDAIDTYNFQTCQIDPTR